MCPGADFTDEYDVHGKTKGDLLRLYQKLSLAGTDYSSKQKASATVVLVAIRARCQELETLQAEISVTYLMDRTGFSRATVLAALRVLEEVGIIQVYTEREDEPSIIEGRVARLFKTSRIVVIREPDLLEPLAYFPTLMLQDKSFKGLNSNTKSMLISLYLMARNRIRFQELLPSIMREAFILKTQTARESLDTLESKGFIRYVNPCVNRHIPYESTPLGFELLWRRLQEMAPD